MKEKLAKINNELKGYINESAFISTKCRNKIITILGEEFDIKFHLENFASIDVTILENGDIIMRGDTYQSAAEINSFSEIEERYNNFKIKADRIIKVKDINKSNKKEVNNILNLFIITIIILVFIGLTIIGVRSLISGNYINCIWLILFSSSWLAPSLSSNLKERIERAKIYLKRKLKK